MIILRSIMNVLATLQTIASTAQFAKIGDDRLLDPPSI